MSQKYYMIKVIKTGSRKWRIIWNKNYCDNRFLKIETPFGTIGWVCSSGDGHNLNERT